VAYGHEKKRPLGTTPGANQNQPGTEIPRKVSIILNTAESKVNRNRKRASGGKTAMTKAIIYTRFSPRRNAEECESIETQMELCRDYCEHKNYEVAGEYEDKALSGAEEDRPGLWMAVAALKRGNVLVVYKLDRLARDMYLSEYVRRAVMKVGATIETVASGGNGTSPEQQLLRQILQAFAEYERKVIAARTKVAMLNHQKKGRRMSAILPYGVMADPNNSKLMIENEEEAKVINRIIEEYANGAGLREIGRILLAEGITYRGKKWTHQTIKKILQRAGAL
jgi:DNA invertase Pin-like site-specific DNA recombinase